MMMKGIWTKEEEQYVIDNHETMTDKEMAENMPLKRDRHIPDRSKTRFAESRGQHWERFIGPNRSL